MKRFWVGTAVALVSILASAFWMRAGATNPENNALLANAANSGNIRMVRAYLSQGADPDARSLPAPGIPWWRQAIDPMNGRIPALTLAASRDASDVVEELLTHGANPDIRDNIASTPLMLECTPKMRQ